MKKQETQGGGDISKVFMLVGQLRVLWQILAPYPIDPRVGANDCQNAVQNKMQEIVNKLEKIKGVVISGDALTGPIITYKGKEIVI